MLMQCQRGYYWQDVAGAHYSSIRFLAPCTAVAHQEVSALFTEGKWESCPREDPLVPQQCTTHHVDWPRPNQRRAVTLFHRVLDPALIIISRAGSIRTPPLQRAVAESVACRLRGGVPLLPAGDMHASSCGLPQRNGWRKREQLERSVISKNRWSGVRRSPVISGPGTLMMAETSPSASITTTRPFSVLSAKSKCATKTSPLEFTARAVGPKRPLNWWKTLQWKTPGLAVRSWKP